MAAAEQSDVSTRTLAVLAFAATAGVVVEFYDFFLYGYAAASAFPSIFFPNLPPTEALVFSYLAFGAGFPARLLGAFIFGHFGDGAGRMSSFLIGIGLVGISTCLTALLPGYATLGILAPILLVLLRIVQGIGLGGEFGGAAALLAEFGAKRRVRAFWMSLANLGIPVGAMLASAALLVFSKTFATTGWRPAMLLSVVIVIPALLARYKLAESPLFERLRQRDRIARRPSLEVWAKHAVPIALLAVVSAFQQMDGYVAGTYAISFMRSSGIGLSTVASLLFIGRVGDMAGVIISGPVADALKRKRTAYVAIAIATALSYPLVRAILGHEIVLLAAVQFFIALFGIGILHGLAPILSSESFPTKYRYSGTGIAYNLSAMLGGMIAPSLLAGLIGPDVAHKWFYVPIVYVVYCATAMIALVFIRETKDLTFDELDEPDLSVS